MNALIQFEKEFRKIFQNPFAGDFAHLANFRQEPQERLKDYSIFKHNDKGIWNIELLFPGLSEEEIQVQVDLESRQLTIEGKKTETLKGEKESITYTKRALLDRHYSFYMDEKFDLESLTAHYDKGILRVEFKEHSLKPQAKKFLDIKVQGAKS